MIFRKQPLPPCPCGICHCLYCSCDVFLINSAASKRRRLPFFILQVSLSLGATIFIDVYLRKPTSKEGNRVNLDKGNLNGEWEKTRKWLLSGNNLRGSTKLYLHEGIDLVNSFTRDDTSITCCYG